ncbi:hypothetical protein JCM10213_008729, partial [Rhodosporidiobolus nylandii]
FADLPSPLDGIFASDASNDALGVFIKLPADPSPLVSAFPLLPNWRSSLEGYIGNAEAWAVEMLVETLVNMGARSNTLTLLCDNTNVVDGWSRGWSPNALNNAAFARLFDAAEKYDLAFNIEYVSTHDNPADEISRLKIPEGAVVLQPPLAPSPPVGTQGGPPPFAVSCYFSA